MKAVQVGTLCSVILAVGVLISCGPGNESARLKEAPDSRNNPALMGVQSKKFDTMVTRASLPREARPWSGDYWPIYRGGISYRWQATPWGSTYRDYQYPLLREEDVFAMSQSELDRLSPAEKYDLLMGDFSFGLTRSEKDAVERALRSNNGDVPYWFGLCHGWAAAAYMEPEPGERSSLVSPDGLLINFYSGDLKALLTRHYSDARVRSDFIGGRCNERAIHRDARGRIIAPECRDVNPATLHLVLEDYIAHRRKSFIIDLDEELAVWNQPVTAYEFSYSGLRPLAHDVSYRYAAAGTVNLVNVDLKIEYALETAPTRQPGSPALGHRAFQYILELDGDGLVLGGEWVSTSRPDFLWELTRLPQQSTDGGLAYQLVRHLVELSRGGHFGVTSAAFSR